MKGMTVYEGVVESRADPLMVGRCKVRVMGVHTEDTDLLPTIELPWALPMGPVTSASVSGIGHSPVGPVEGTWVYVFFADGENKQQPVMMGTLYGIPESQNQSFSDSAKSINGTAYEGLSDNPDDSTKGGGNTNGSNGNTNGASGSGTSGEQVLTQNGNSSNTSTTGSTKTDSNGSYKLGQISKKYESGSSGPGTVSTGNGDAGGVSYGTHQLASYRDQQGNSKGKGSTNSPVEKFVSGSKYASEFKGLVPGTSAFTAKWKEVASKDSAGFEDAQYQYFKGEYYNVGSNKIKAAGIDLSNRGPAVQEAIWSTSIQYGTGGARQVFVRALDGKDIGKMSDAEIITAVQNDKIKNVDVDFKSSSEKVKNGVRSRIAAEKTDLIKLAGDDGKPSNNEQSNANDNTLSQNTDANNTDNGNNAAGETGNSQGDYNEDSIYKPPKDATATSGVTVPKTVTRNIRPGFVDPNLKYPKSNWLNESDLSRLARNEKITETIIESKRNSRVSNVGTAGGGRWDEPQSPYAAKYPLNHVYQSESGHVQEFDDTPNAERVHTYHRSGSFVEMHPNGDVVYKSVKNQYEITVSDRNIYVGGTCNITVAGDSNVFTKGVARMESDGDMFISTKSNMKIGAMGTMHIESNGEMFVGSSNNCNVAGSNIFLNCGWSAESVMAGGYNAGNIAVQVMYDVAEIVTPLDESKTIKELQDSGTIPKDGSSGSGSGGSSGNNSNGSGNTTDSGSSGTEEDSDPKGNEQAATAEEIDPNMQLSPNFKLADLSTSAYYGHAVKAQNGMTKADIVANLKRIANNVLEPLVSKYGKSSFIITSGFRAGTGTSQHLKGEAVDIQFPALGDSSIVSRATEISGLVPFDQMIIEYHGNKPVFHISNSSSNRGQKLSTPNLQKYFSGFRNRDMSLPK